jgi:hypothetical protein
MITLVQKVHIFFWKVWEDVLYVFHFVITIILKIKVALQTVFSGVSEFIKSTFKIFLKYFNQKIATALFLTNRPNFAYIRVKSENKSTDYKSLAPPVR